MGSELIFRNVSISATRSKPAFIGPFCSGVGHVDFCCKVEGSESLVDATI